MDEARIRPNEFREMGQERNDVVFRFALDFVDPPQMVSLCLRVLDRGPDRLEG